jgi:hypothetical protein
MYFPPQIDLSCIVSHECGHIVTDAKNGRLFRVMKVRSDGSGANTTCFGWRHPFPSKEAEELEKTQDQRIRQVGIGGNLFATYNAQARADEERAQADEDIPLSDLLMTYAAGYEAEALYASQCGQDTAVIEAIRRDAERSQDYANMHRTLHKQGYTEESQVDAFIEQAKEEAIAVLINAEIAQVWEAVVHELMQVLYAMSDGEIEHQLKWYELTEATRAALVGLSEYAFDRGQDTRAE